MTISDADALLEGTRQNHRWKVVHIRNRHFAGYVRSNFGPAWHYDYLMFAIDAPGGLTYGVDEDGWLGFDCAHAWDVCILDDEVVSGTSYRDAQDTTRWTPDDVAEACLSLAEEVKRVEDVLHQFESIGWGHESSE